MSSQWFKPAGPDVAVFAEFDEAMQSFMTQANVRGGSLAIIKDGRLVYARGYTYDEPYKQLQGNLSRKDFVSI